MRPEFVSLNRHIVVHRAFVVWGYAACLVRRVLLDMLLRDAGGAWHLSHRTARGQIPLRKRNKVCETMEGNSPLFLPAVGWSDR
jgi:hypothetical protein